MPEKEIEGGRKHPFFKGVTNVPEVIAHRGGGGEWPGETIYAFEQACKAGADVLEMDVRYTADDDLVLMHNSNVKDWRRQTWQRIEVKRNPTARCVVLVEEGWRRVSGERRCQPTRASFGGGASSIPWRPNEHRN